MIKEFKDFLFRGNIIELAVAFVMGLAFAAVVKRGAPPPGAASRTPREQLTDPGARGAWQAAAGKE
jgi:hypothetical protein